MSIVITNQPKEKRKKKNLQQNRKIQNGIYFVLTTNRDSFWFLIVTFRFSLYLFTSLNSTTTP